MGYGKRAQLAKTNPLANAPTLDQLTEAMLGRGSAPIVASDGTIQLGNFTLTFPAAVGTTTLSIPITSGSSSYIAEKNEIILTRLSPDPGALPLGPQVWEDSWLMLPAGGADHHYRNLFTGETVAAVRWEGRAVLALGEVFANFPVALLASFLQ